MSACYRCLKCTAGCPMAEAMDYQPDRLIRMVQLGLKDQALGSRSVWLCTGCLSCSERCPNGIDVARVVDTLKQMVLGERRRPGEPQIAVFHDAFLNTLKAYGRLHEATLIGVLKLRNHNWTSDLGLGIKMFLKRKIPLMPRRVRAREVAAMLDAARRQASSPPRHEDTKKG